MKYKGLLLLLLFVLMNKEEALETLANAGVAGEGQQGSKIFKHLLKAN